jgi:hypothetical protein
LPLVPGCQELPDYGQWEQFYFEIAGSIGGFSFSPVLGTVVGGFIGINYGSRIIELIRGRYYRETLNATQGALSGWQIVSKDNCYSYPFNKSSPLIII